MSIWEYANPKKFMQTSGAVLPWVASLAAICLVTMDPDGGLPIPFTRFVDRETLYECLADRLYMVPNDAYRNGALPWLGQSRLAAPLHGPRTQ